jgi:lipid-A-disaccharide synthase
MSDRQGETIFLSAAEASGDEHAAALIHALRRRRPEARFVGVAGPRMAEAGCEVVADVTDQAAMLGGPVLRLGYWVKMIRRIRRRIGEIAPDLHVPIDSPALNWHLAEASRAAGSPVLYYIAPQVWAWAPWRAKRLARLTDAVACILPFEEDYLRSRGVEATFVGNPLFDHLPPRPASLPDLTDAWYDGTWQVTFAPGSRRSEIRGHVRGMVAVARAIRRRWSSARCVFAARTRQDAERIAEHGAGEEEIVIGRTREMLARSHFAVLCSGTVTLQAAHFGVPSVVVYRTGWSMRALHWLFRHIPGVLTTRRLSLVNILAGGEIIPELMPWRGNVHRLVETVLSVMGDLGLLFEMRKGMLEVAAPLRVEPPGSASDNAAELICRLLDER